MTRTTKSSPGAIGGGDVEDNANPRSDRRQKQVKHLVACGERCVLEALIAVDNGQPLDLVLRGFEKLSPETYKLTSKIIRGTT